jgi:class 3 adenylate cyclase
MFARWLTTIRPTMTMADALETTRIHRCPQCGADALPRAKFCGECGTPLTAQNPAPPFAHPPSPLRYTPGYLAEKILTSKAALEGERKQVTVLFADLKGSMELLADRDPEEARQLLDPVLERMMAAVHRYEGTVNQVMGDGVMALFGAPIAHEDHAIRACYAALAMQAAMQHYAEEVRRIQGLAVQMRVGQTTHLAARMEQLATPGSILLTSATLRLVEGFIRANALGPVPIKGVAEPVEVFELRGATVYRGRLQGSRSGADALCGAAAGAGGAGPGADAGRGGPGAGGGRSRRGRRG